MKNCEWDDFTRSFYFNSAPFFPLTSLPLKKSIDNLLLSLYHRPILKLTFKIAAVNNIILSAILNTSLEVVYE